MSSPGTPPDALPEAARRLPAHAHFFYEHTTHTHHRRRQMLRTGRLHPAQTEAEQTSYTGASCTLRHAGTVGHAATSHCTPAALQAALTQARTRQVQPAGPLPTTAQAPPSPPAITHLLTALSDAAFGWDARVTATRVEVEHRTRQTGVWTRQSATGLHTATLARLRLSVDVQLEGGQTWTGRAAAPYPPPDATPPEILARAAVADAYRQARARPVVAGTWPVVIAPGWGGVWLHELIGHSLEADVWSADRFPLGGRIGPALLTVIDSATDPGGRATAPFDDEGTPTQRTLLIDQGRVKSVLTDAHHAARLKCPRTGNGRRQDYRFPPLPRMGNLVLAPGTDRPEALRQQVQNGLWITHLRHGTVRPAPGTFALDVQAGYRLEHGEVTTPLRPFQLTGRTETVLQHLEAVGADFELDTTYGTCEKAGQRVPISVGQPTVLFGQMAATPAP